MNAAIPQRPPARPADREAPDAKTLAESLMTLPPPKLHVPTEAEYGCVDWYPYHATPQRPKVTH